VAPRAHWKGFLKLSLVSCPVALYPAVAASERISFRQINKQTGNRLRQQFVNVVTGEPVQAHNKGRGYEVGENQFLEVRDDELEAAEREGRRRPYSSLPGMPREENNDQPQPVNLQAPKPLFRNARMKGTTRREDAPQTAPAEPKTTPDPTPPSAAIAVPAPTPIENNRTIEIDRFIPLRRSTHAISMRLTTSFRATR
jgi:DNA end-binding protein Ku